MKKIITIGAVAIAFILGGCSSTTITKYDSLGNVIEKTESSENAFVMLASGLEKKDNFIHISGWCVGTNPSANIYGVGAFDVVAGSINNETGATNSIGYSTMIDNSKVKLDITANKDGITATASKDEAKSTTLETEEEQ